MLDIQTAASDGGRFVFCIADIRGLDRPVLSLRTI